MPIQHIVLEGGSYLGLYALGALYELDKHKYYDINNIKTIYGTSVGAFIGALLCLKMDWDTLLDYIKDRPWHKIVHFSSDMILEIFSKKGVFDSSFFTHSFKNLLEANEFTLDVTLQELYDHSKIELHIFITEVRAFTLLDVSYKTHPNMSLLEAVYKSSSLPFVFQPQWNHNTYYLDGGLLNNYPVNVCIEQGAKKSDIIGIKYNISKEDTSSLTQEMNVLEFFLFLCRKFFSLQRKQNQVDIPNEIIIPCKITNVKECQRLLQNKELRKKYIEKGGKEALAYLTSKNKI